MNNRKRRVVLSFSKLSLLTADLRIRIGHGEVVALMNMVDAFG